jgi:DNA-binding NtrC family response regulator
MAKILLVDDEEQLRSMLKIVLEDAGHEVEEAGNGKEAAEKYQRRPVELMVTDIVMPDEEGIETIIKFRKSHPNAKILAMSGGGRKGRLDYLELAQKFGAHGTLAKPFSNSEFLTKVSIVLQQS